MLSRTIRIQLVVFVIVAVVGVLYLGIYYVGALRWFGAGGYTVRLDLPESGGIYSNAQVSYRGVQLGKVGDMRLTGSGIQVDLDITSSTPIPRQVHATVADGSVIGEQYVDLSADDNSGPYLRDGSTIPQSATTLPPPVQDMVHSSEQLFASVPIDSLRTVVNELYDATNNVGPDLQNLITSTNTFFTKADGDFDNTSALIANSKTVLATQQSEAGQISQFSTNLALIGKQLRSSNGDISKVLADTAPSVDQLGGLISTLNSNGTLSTLLTSLLTTSTTFLQGKNGLQTLLVRLPTDVSIGNSVITPQGLNVGLVPTFFDPLPCTKGYQGTKKRPGSATSAGPPLNTSAGCTAGLVRGTQNAPHG